VPKHACGGTALTGDARYPYATAAGAEAACAADGCAGGLAPASVMNSPWYAWMGRWAEQDNSTAVRQQCYAAWYVNDIGFVQGGTAHAHEQLYYMHDANPVAGCGVQGMNHWEGAGERAAAACLGCPYFHEECPSPPPTSPPPLHPPPSSPPPPPSPPPPALPLPHAPVAEPSQHIKPLEVAAIVLGSLLGLIFLLGVVLGLCCAAPIAAAATDCKKPPDKTKDPAAYARWQRECERKLKESTGAHLEGVQLLRMSA